MMRLMSNWICAAIPITFLGVCTSEAQDDLRHDLEKACFDFVQACKAGDLGLIERLSSAIGLVASRIIMFFRT